MRADVAPRAVAAQGAVEAAPTLALAARSLCVRFGAHEVLRDVSLQLPPAQWTAVVGPNGAGKSTLLRALAGLQQPDSGEVWLEGRPLADWPRLQRARQLAWLAQGADTTDNLRVGECVALGRFPYTGWWSQDSEADRRAIAQALAATGAQAWSQRRMRTLSGGERQRVLLARALALQAPVMLLDEPTAFLDPPHQQDVARLMRTLARSQDVAVVSAIHDLSLALLADRLVVLGGGGVIGHGTPQQALQGDWLTQAFGARIDIIEHHGQPVWKPRLSADPENPA
jgi:iron complex transport system ATP-binding protein